MEDAVAEEQRRWRTRRRRSSGDQETKCWEKRNKAHTYIGWGSFVPGEVTTRDKMPFCPGSWLHPGQKVFLGGPGKGACFPSFRQILCLFLFLFTSLLK